MKLRISIVIFLSQFLIQCQSYKIYKNQEISLLSEKAQPFEILGKKMVTPVIVDEKETLFTFDTGATATIILDTTIVENYTNKEKASFGISLDAQSKNVKRFDFLVSVSNNLVSSPRKQITYLQVPNMSESFDCVQKKENGRTGIFGMDFFDWEKTDYSLFINFTNNSLKNIEQQEKLGLLNSGFKEIKSKFSFIGKIFIYLNINGKTHKMQFDTGHSGGLLLPYKTEVANFEGLKFNQILGSNYASLSGIAGSGRTNYYSDVKVEIEDSEYRANVTLSENLNISNAGIDFLSGFDWIVDFNNKKIFYKRNSNDFLRSEPKKGNSVLARNGQLEIFTIEEKWADKFRPGNILSEIDGIEITRDNLCEMQEKVNSAENWNDLKMVLLKTKN